MKPLITVTIPVQPCTAGRVFFSRHRFVGLGKATWLLLCVGQMDHGSTKGFQSEFGRAGATGLTNGAG